MNIANDEILDLTNLREITEGDLDLEKTLIQEYIKDTEVNIQQLRNQCVDGHNETWSGVAHTLKGASANVGAMKLSKICSKAQAAIDSSCDERNKILKEILDCYSEVSERIKLLYGEL